MILNLDSCLVETPFKDFSKTILFLALVTNLYSRVKQFVLCLVEAILGNNYMKLFYIWISGSGGDVVLRFFSIFSSSGHLDQQSRTTCNFLVEVIMATIHLKLFKFVSVVQEKMSFKEKVYVRCTKTTSSILWTAQESRVKVEGHAWLHTNNGCILEQ